MTPGMMRAAVDLNAGRAKLEASGNVTLDNVRQVAETGVDTISIGALTHSAKVLDVSFDLGAGGEAEPNSSPTESTESSADRFVTM